MTDDKAIWEAYSCPVSVRVYRMHATRPFTPSDPVHQREPIRQKDHHVVTMRRNNGAPTREEFALHAAQQVTFHALSRAAFGLRFYAVVEIHGTEYHHVVELVATAVRPGEVSS